MSIGEHDLARSIVEVNKLSSQLQKVSADGRKRKQMRDIATQMIIECNLIREATEPPLVKVKPGLLSRWFGNGKD
jgi:hypothetical protein